MNAIKEDTKPKVAVAWGRGKRRFNGRGFSPKELKAAGVPVKGARAVGIPVDLRRKTEHAENVEALKREWAERAKSLKAKAPRRPLEKGKVKAKEVAKAAAPARKKQEKAEEGTKAAAGGTDRPDWASQCPFCKNAYKTLGRHKCKKVPAGDARYALELLPGLDAKQLRQLRDLGVADTRAMENEEPAEVAAILGIDEATVAALVAYCREFNKIK
ncbi:MAG: hypothetical protein Kow0069_39450 [Promethearchaeota archaeon]